MNPEPEPAADTVRRYLEFWQRIPVSGQHAAAMARELRAYAAATEGMRATLSASDQPTGFASALAAKRPTVDEAAP